MEVIIWLFFWKFHLKELLPKDERILVGYLMSNHEGNTCIRWDVQAKQSIVRVDTFLCRNSLCWVDRPLQVFWCNGLKFKVSGCGLCVCETIRRRPRSTIFPQNENETQNADRARLRPVCLSQFIVDGNWIGSAWLSFTWGLTIPGQHSTSLNPPPPCSAVYFNTCCTLATALSNCLANGTSCLMLAHSRLAMRSPVPMKNEFNIGYQHCLEGLCSNRFSR